METAMISCSHWGLIEKLSDDHLPRGYFETSHPYWPPAGALYSQPLSLAYVREMLFGIKA